MNNPKISILLAVCNGERYLDASISSILAQTYLNYELIICSNGCTDRTEQIIQNYLDLYPGRIIHWNEREANKSKALNKCLALSTGDFIAIQDADDLWLPHKLKEQINYTGYDVIGSLITYIDQDSHILGYPFMTAFLHERIVDLAFTGENPIANCTSLIRADLLKHINGWDSDYEGIEDFELWLRIMSRTTAKFTNVNTVLAYHRIHSFSHFNSKDQSVKTQQLFNKYKIKQC